jgi:hypothetical protein
MATKRTRKGTKRLKKAKNLEATKPLAYQAYIPIKGQKQG